MAKKNKLSLLQRIGENSDKFPPKQRKLAQYIEKNYASLTYTTMTELARLADVSETTVVRFVYQLGYSGFSEFMSALRTAVEQAPTKASTINPYNLESKEYQFPRDTVKAIFNLEMQVIDETLSLINLKEHQKAVDMIYSAPAVVVLACGADSCASQALGFSLQAIRPNVYVIEKLGLPEGALIRSIPEGSVCVAFTTPRYPVETQDALEELKTRKVRVIGVSDSVLSPIVPYCEVFFQIPVKYVTFINTNAAFMALIHSFVFGLQLKDKKSAKQGVDAYNKFTKKQNFYVKDFLDLVDF